MTEPTIHIEFIEALQLAGIRQRMSLADNRTGALWSRFIPLSYGITNRANANRYSLQVYDAGYFERFDPAAEFDKWALVAVTDTGSLPPGVLPFVLPAGLYAIFTHSGDTAAFASSLQYVFTQWLPASDYELDNRPHFEVPGPGYRLGDPEAAELVYVPVRHKG